MEKEAFIRDFFKKGCIVGLKNSVIKDNKRQKENSYDCVEIFLDKRQSPIPNIDSQNLNIILNCKDVNLLEVHINILNYVPTIIVPILNFKKKALKINRDHNKYEVVTFKWLSRFTRHNGLIKKIENSKLVLEYDPFSIRVGLNPIIRSSELIREYFRNMTNYIDMLYIEIAPGLYAFAKNYSSDECLIVNASGEWSIVTLQKIFDYYLESMIQPLHEQAKSSTMALKIATENFKQYDSSNSIFDNYIL